MKDLSFYEQVGIVLPGSILLLGVLFLMPELRAQFMANGISVGGLGLFLIVAYALGHLVAAAGNLLEWLFWLPWKGMPSEWVVRERRRLLPEAQLTQVESKVKARLGLDVDLSSTSRKDWQPIFRRLFGEVRTAEPEGMNLTFNGNYGLNRGMATAMLSWRRDASSSRGRAGSNGAPRSPRPGSSIFIACAASRFTLPAMSSTASSSFRTRRAPKTGG